MPKVTLHLPADHPGPRGFSRVVPNDGKSHIAADIVLDPGEVREGLELNDEELELALGNGLVKGKPKGSAEESDAAAEPKPFAKMNRAELDVEVDKAKASGFTLPEDATTNKAIAEALQAHSDKQS